MMGSRVAVRERPTTGKMVLVGGFTEPLKAVDEAASRMHFPDISYMDIDPLSFEWAMENPNIFARKLNGARFLGNSAATVALVGAKRFAKKPGFGLTEAVTVAGVERRSYPRLFGGYALLLAHQTGTAVEKRGTNEGRISGGLVRAKAGELSGHLGDLRRLGAIHDASTMEILTSLGETGVPTIAGYMIDDEMGFQAPRGKSREAFQAAGGSLVELPRLGHEGVLIEPDVILPVMYSHLNWTETA